MNALAIHLVGFSNCFKRVILVYAYAYIEVENNVMPMVLAVFM